jgi:hypothetical protein
LEGNNANHYTSHADGTSSGVCEPTRCAPHYRLPWWGRCKMVLPHCILRGSNPRGLRPLGLKSSALTTRPRMRVRKEGAWKDGTQKGWCSQSETRTHNLPVNSRARCRLRHPGTRMMNICRDSPKKVCTACGDRTRDQSIKSRTLYLTELRRPVIQLLVHTRVPCFNRGDSFWRFISSACDLPRRCG